MFAYKVRMRKHRKGPRRWWPAPAVAALIGLTALGGFASSTYAMPPGSRPVHISSCPETVAEGDSFVVRVASAADTARVGFFLRLDPLTAGPSDYLSQGGVHNAPNPHDLTFHTIEDDLVEGDETFTINVGSDQYRIGDRADQRCVMRIIDDDVTRVRSVQIASTPFNGHTYRFGETITVEVTFDDTVRVQREPTAILWLGNPEGSPWTPPTNNWEWKRAEYAGGSGTDTLSFAYTIRRGDVDTDGVIVAPTNSMGMGEGTIRHVPDGHDADHTHSGLLTNQKVDGGS